MGWEEGWEEAGREWLGSGLERGRGVGKRLGVGWKEAGSGLGGGREFGSGLERGREWVGKR